MEQKIASFQNKGMTRDLSISKVNKEFAFENFNIRITARDNDTLLSVTNERGNKKVSICEESLDPETNQITILTGTEFLIKGTLIGHSVLNNYLILFTHSEEDSKDYIYRITYHPSVEDEGRWSGYTIYSGNLNFSTEHPIEVLSNYESEGIQKVYWVDGMNLPRFVNIANSQLKSTVNVNGLFDFIIKIDKYPEVTISKQFMGTSQIPSGVLQYVFTYSNENGQETNITYRSPLFYSSFFDRGADAETIPNNSFSIRILNSDTRFDYINIYRVMRTSENGTPTASRIARLKTSEIEVSYVDNGVNLSDIDPTTLLYVGGRSIYPYTLSQKDNTLFLGNFKVDSSSSDPEISKLVSIGRDEKTGLNSNLEFKISTSEKDIPYVDNTGLYPYTCQLNYSEDQIKSFKGGEKYRIGIRFMKGTGELSSVYWIGDQENTIYPQIDIPSQRIKRAYLIYRFPQDPKTQKNIAEIIWDKGYRYAELMMAEASDSDRKILAQGLVCPTLFNLKQRYSNAPFSVSSWYFRPVNGEIYNLHYQPVGTSNQSNGEIQCAKALDFGDDPYSGMPTPYGATDFFGEEYKSMRYTIEVWNDKGLGIIWQRNIRWNLEYSTKTVDENPGDGDFVRIASDNNIGTNWGRIFEKFVRPALKSWGFNASNIPSTDTFRDWVEADQEREGWRRIGSGGPIAIGTLRGSMGYDYSNVMSSNYFVDESICTFHSPECAGEEANKFDNTNCNFRIVGIAPLSSTMTDYDLTIEGNRLNTAGGLGIINFNQPIGSKDLTGLLTMPLWMDATSKDDINVMRTFWIYPWHKTGSITRTEIDGVKYSVLNTKHEANLRFSLYTDYMFADNPWTPANGIETIRAYTSKEASLVSLNTQWGSKTYQANGDWLLTMSKVLKPNDDVNIEPKRDQGYFVYKTGDNITPSSDLESLRQAEFQHWPDIGDGNINQESKRTYDPLQISFKSPEHLVFSFKGFEEGPEVGNMVILPYVKYGSDNYHYVNDIDPSIKDKVYLPWVDQMPKESNLSSIIVFPYEKGQIEFLQESSTEGTLSLKVPYTWHKKNNDSLTKASWILAESSTGTITLYSKGGSSSFAVKKEAIPASWSITITDIQYDEDTGKLSANVEQSKSSHAESIEITWSGKLSGNKTVTSSQNRIEFGTISKTDEGTHTITLNMKAISSDSTYWNDSVNQEIGTVTLIITKEEIPPVEEGGDPTYEYTYNTSSQVTYNPITPQESDNIIIYSSNASTYSEGTNYFFEINGVAYTYYNGVLEEYKTKSFGYYRTPVNIDSDKYDINNPFFYIGELYNTFEVKQPDGSIEIVDTRYGGVSDSALESNTFIPICSPIRLKSARETLSEEIPISDISAYNGDTYVSRYDILKTLPYSDEAENSITEIASVLLETHKNIDGRTDTNRGNSKMLGITEENFNLFNNVYSSENNFYSGAVLSSKKYENNIFPSQITWSKTKTPNEDIDTWTNITLASTLDLDGDKGPVRAIRRFQNSLIAFQDKGIAEILFNSRTQLATAQGVPIEIANSGKVDGKRYITDKAGCLNKWSIVETSRGIYFIDNINSSISIFNGSVQSLSDAKGFKAWIGRNNSTDLWTPKNFDNFISFWDRVNDDVYFLRGSDIEDYNVLCYNEQTQQFSSFYNYGQVPMMVNLQDRFVAFKDNSLWEQGEGQYNNIFGNLQEYHILYRITPDPYGDKIFTNLEYRADIFDMSKTGEDANPYMPLNGVITGETFDTLSVWNEYQGNEVHVQFSIKDTYPDKRRKFRIWRMDIPRDKKSADNPHGLNRIRNPWIYLKLSRTPTIPDERMEFHDLAVRYYE